MASVIPKRPVHLTVRQQNLLADVCQTLAGVVYEFENSRYESAESRLIELLSNYVIMESKSQEWGILYDIMHRTGENM